MRACWPALFPGVALLSLSNVLAAPEGLQPDQVQGAFLEDWKVLHEGPYAKTGSFVADGGHLASASLAAAAEVREAEWTGDRSRFLAAAARLKEVARRGLATNEADFFTSFPFSWAYEHVAKAGAADEELTKLAAEYAERKFKPRDEGHVFNQTFIRACGLAMAAKVWPHSSMAGAWKKYANGIFDDFLKLQDVPENSTDYNAFDLLCPFLLGDLIGRTEELRTEGIKKFYERYMAQTSPSGFIPPYGDAGTAPRDFTPEWPMQNAWGFYVSAFERAGALWADPHFRWIAQHIFKAGRDHQRLTRDYADLQELFYLTFAADWMNPAILPERPDTHSAVLVRTDQQGPNQPDKLLLASSHEPGSPFLLADVYARGDHAHENQPGAIVYYEYGDQALLASTGYNNRNPEYANLPILRPGTEPFPFTEGLFQPGVWHEAELPTNRLPPISSANPNLRRLKDLTWRVTAGKRGVEATIGQLELVDTDGHTQTVEQMDDPSSWTGPKGLPGERSNEPGEPTGLAWQLPAGVTFLNKARESLDFDCHQYPLLRLRWKLSNNDEQARPLILRLAPGVDYRVCIPQLFPRLVSVQAGERDGVQCGYIHYAGWFIPQSELSRQIAVFPDGMLVVCDRLRPGKDAIGLRAGQIWHFLPLGVPEMGPNWFNTTEGRDDLLIVLNPAQGRSFGRSTINLWSKSEQQSVYASTVVSSETPLTFTAVLLPHSPAEPAAKLASQVETTERDGRVRVQVAEPNQQRSVDFGEKLDWKIKYSPKARGG